jgi:hypothetical protein
MLSITIMFGQNPFSTRLTHGPKLDALVWLLRSSVLRGTPTASAENIQFQNAKVLPEKKIVASRTAGEVCKTDNSGATDVNAPFMTAP